MKGKHLCIILAMKKNCKNCGSEFEVADEDLEFYEKVSPVFGRRKYEIPPPTLCPDCRQQRRLAWRNERNLYKRKCDATGKDIISVFSSEKVFPVYNNDYWYSDKWNALDYGRDFDFNRPFFEQFEQLMNEVPQLSRSAVGNYNSDYTNQSGWNKNCYLIFEADYDEDCMYSINIYESKKCLDVFCAMKCELCYDCLNCQNCYNLKFSQNCQNCSDSFFLKDCIGCKNCFGCVNLRNKQYYFLNEKYSKEEYERKISEINLETYANIKKMKENFRAHAKKFPHKYLNGTQNEDSTGDYLQNTQRCKNCFNVEESQDCKNVFEARNIRQTQDLTVFGSRDGADFCYDNHEIGAGVRNVCFSDQVWEGGYDIYYSKLCIKNSKKLFGCVGLKHQEYCVLNKKYSAEDYESLVAKIIEHMQSTGEWGEFFPAEISPLAYNETMAQMYFPLEKEVAVSAGYGWKDKDEKEYQVSDYKIPDRIENVSDDIVGRVLACEKCGKNYRIESSELKFYKRSGLPIPLECFECRHMERFGLRNPRRLYDRKCDKCGVELQTTFSPDRDEKVYCEECYLEEVD